MDAYMGPSRSRSVKIFLTQKARRTGTEATDLQGSVSPEGGLTPGPSHLDFVAGNGVSTVGFSDFWSSMNDLNASLRSRNSSARSKCSRFTA